MNMENTKVNSQMDCVMDTGNVVTQMVGYMWDTGKQTSNTERASTNFQMVQYIRENSNETYNMD